MKYPIHVVIDYEEDCGETFPTLRREHYRAANPGDLFTWAQEAGWSDAGWDEIEKVVYPKHTHCAKNADEHKMDSVCPGCCMRLDELAQEWVDATDSIAVTWLSSDAAYKKLLDDEGHLQDEYAAPDDDGTWHAFPIQTCACEDYPCCVHADDMAYVRY